MYYWKELNSYFYISNNYGVSWDSVSFDNIGWPSSYPFWVEYLDNTIHFKDEHFGGYWISHDKGQSWSEIKGGNFGVDPIIKYMGKLLAHNTSEILESSDNGRTWTTFSNNLPGDVWELQTDGDRLFALLNNTLSGRTSLYFSVDGIQWTYCQDGLPNLSGLNRNHLDRDYHWFTSSGDRTFIYHKYIGLYEAIDSFRYWVPIESYHFNDVVFHKDTLYGSTFGAGVFKADAGQITSKVNEGVVFWDRNGNQNLDAIDKPLGNIKVGAIDNSNPRFNAYAWTDTAGYYFLGALPTRTDSLKPFFRHTQSILSISPEYYLIDDPTPFKDFAIELDTTVNDFSVNCHLTPPPRPGFTSKIIIKGCNIGAVEGPAAVTLRLGDGIEFLSSNPPPDIVTSDSIVWDYSNFPLFSCEKIIVEFKTDTSTPLGYELKNIIGINPEFIDKNYSNNLCIRCDTVVGSFDPNDKRVSPSEGLTEKRNIRRRRSHLYHPLSKYRNLLG